MMCFLHGRETTRNLDLSASLDACFSNCRLWGHRGSNQTSRFIRLCHAFPLSPVRRRPPAAAVRYMKRWRIHGTVLCIDIDRFDCALVSFGKLGRVEHRNRCRGEKWADRQSGFGWTLIARQGKNKTLTSSFWQSRQYRRERCRLQGAPAPSQRQSRPVSATEQGLILGHGAACWRDAVSLLRFVLYTVQPTVQYLYPCTTASESALQDSTLFHMRNYTSKDFPTKTTRHD